MILGPGQIPKALFTSLTQRVCALMKTAPNHPFCLWSGC